jgi:hypothetical protein
VKHSSLDSSAQLPGTGADRKHRAVVTTDRSDIERLAAAARHRAAVIDM